LEEKSNWAMEGGLEGENPFTQRKQEKKLKVVKEEKKQMKNLERNGYVKKTDGDGVKGNKLKTDKKRIDKTLEIGKYL
jgi:hypothetical protein